LTTRRGTAAEADIPRGRKMRIMPQSIFNTLKSSFSLLSSICPK